MKIISRINDDKYRDGSIIFMLNLFISIINFATTVILIRILEQKGFGNFVIISNFILLMQVLVSLRTGEAVIRYLKEDTQKEEKNGIINQLLVIDAVLNILLYFIIIFFGYFYALSISLNYNYILAYGSVVILNMGLSIFENIYIINNNIVKLHIIKFVTIFISFILTISFGFLWQLKGIIIGILIGSFIKNIIHFYFVRNDVQIISFNISKVKFISIKELFQFFKHAYLSTTFKSGVLGLDIFMLTTVLGSEKIAIYDAAKKFAQIPGLIIGSVWAAESHKIVRYAQSSQFKKLYSIIKDKYKTLIPLGLFLSLIFLFKGKVFIEFVYGSLYTESFTLAYIFFIFFWFGNLLGGYGRIFLVSINKVKILTFLNGLLFFNVLLVGYFFARYNLIYMTLTICVTILFNGLYLNYYILKRSK